MLPQSLMGPILIVVVVLSLLGQAFPLYTDYLWFQEVKLTSVFTTILWTKAVLALAAGLAFALLVYVNVRLAARSTSGDVLVELDDPFGLHPLLAEPFLNGDRVRLGLAHGSGHQGARDRDDMDDGNGAVERLRHADAVGKDDAIPRRPVYGYKNFHAQL